MQKNPIKILVVEDDDFCRLGIELTLQKVKGKKVVGQALNGETAIKLAKSLKPDVILMDIILPKMNGIEATKRILKTNPHIVILMLTAHNKEPLMVEAIKAGAQGFISKEEGFSKISKIIDSVLNGKPYFETMSIPKLISYHSPFNNLSSREREVLDLVLQGYDNKPIMKKLKISYRTFQMHRNNIYNKLKVKNDIQLLYLAHKYYVTKFSN